MEYPNANRYHYHHPSYNNHDYPDHHLFGIRAFYYMPCVLKRSLLMRNCTHTTTAGKLSKLPLIITIISTIVVIVNIIVVTMVVH